MGTDKDSSKSEQKLCLESESEIGAKHAAVLCFDSHNYTLRKKKKLAFVYIHNTAYVLT